MLKEVSALLNAAQKHQVPVFVDPKIKSLSSYLGVQLLKPNQKEFEAVVGTSKDPAEFYQKGVKLRQQMNIGALLVTLGEAGMTLFQADQEPLHINAEKTDVYDVTGAGDTVISVLAATATAGIEIEQACRIANMAAAQASKHNVAISSYELQQLLISSNLDHDIILSMHQAEAVINLSRKYGKRIVFTNGCFDILHQGHVQCLQQAKALGDHLLVAVNDDASIARIKGKDRPINTIEQRLSVLASLTCVDWLVSFSEDTPASLIKALKPDILAKGGNYKVADIVGYDIVKAYGGEVRALDLVPGISSTRIINKVLGKG